MTTRSLTIAAGLATAALLLTACGGSGTGGSGGSIDGAQGTKSPSPSPSATASGPARPTISLPADLHLVFVGDSTGDPAKDAVLHDNEEFIRATHQAIARQDPNDAAYRFYAEGPAGSDTYDFIKEFVDAHLRSTGTARYYDRQVTVRQGGEATISYCEDQSKAYAKDVKTGKVDVTPATRNSYVSYAGSMKKNADGIWVTEQLVSVRGAAKCQP